MKKSIIVIAGCLLCVFGFQAFTTLHQPGFHNLKILPKDISKDGLDSVMHFFTASLGVHCTYCHEGDPATRKMDFASDAKPEKQIARKMMLMNIDINKNDFQQIAEAMDSGKFVMPTDTAAVSYMLKYVTCYTCHHGDPHPENKPPKMMENNRPPMPPGPPQGNNNQ
ncbi:MAG TPA: c-type cytochrome [Hanamia sp.]